MSATSSMLDQMELISDSGADGGRAVEPVFSRHETFHPRYGWLKKACDAAIEAPDVFLRDDATVTLGVGKNMVRAIRYWAEAFKVLGRRPNAERPRLDDAVPTEFGMRLLGPAGRDPFLEKRASLWLLHWRLMEPPCIAPSWYLALGKLSAPTVTVGSLEGEIRRFCDEQLDWGEVAANSIKKDVRCLLKMYAAITTGRDLPEDSIDSPFLELGLMHPLPTGDGALAFHEGPKRGLPDLLVAYACVRFVRFDNPGLAPVARLATEPGSPGVVFKMSESDLTAALQRCAANFGGIRIAKSAGTSVLAFNDDLDELALRLLEAVFDAADTPVLAA